MRAVITGASAGIGKALAWQLAQNGYDLVLVARREKLLNDLKATLLNANPLISVEVLPADLTNDAVIKQVISQLKKHEINLFINNAGVGYFGPFLEQRTDRTLQMLALLTATVTQFTREIGAHMATHGGGTIVNIASVVAYNRTFPSNAVYAAAKRYVWDFSRAVNYENKKRQPRVRIVSVLPGAIATAWQANASPSQRPLGEKASHYVMKATAVDIFARRVVHQILNTQKVPSQLASLATALN